MAEQIDLSQLNSMQLGQLVDQGHITPEQAQNAISANFMRNNPNKPRVESAPQVQPTTIVKPGFIDAVKSFGSDVQKNRDFFKTVNDRANNAIIEHVPESLQPITYGIKEALVPESDTSALIQAGTMGAGKAFKVGRQLLRGGEELAPGVMKLAGTEAKAVTPTFEKVLGKTETIRAPGLTEIRNTPRNMDLAVGRINQNITPEMLKASTKAPVAMEFQNVTNKMAKYDPNAVSSLSKAQPEFLDAVNTASKTASSAKTITSKEGNYVTDRLTQAAEGNMRPNQSHSEFFKQMTGVDVEKLGMPKDKAKVSEWFNKLSESEKEAVKGGLGKIESYNRRQNSSNVKE